MENPLLDKAVSSRDLGKRIEANRLYAGDDFNLWVNKLLNGLSFSSVLDVCCGTGNQLALYASMPEIEKLVGIDVSGESLNKARERLNKRSCKAEIQLKALKMEEMFSDPELERGRFDLISCFYGLYYSQDPKETLRGMIDHLRGKGVILIVGPYGRNNTSLFALLERHFSLPDLVVRSSTTFMEKEVYPILLKHCEVRKEHFVNQIYYPSPKALIDYWKVSTFYFPEHEHKVIRDVEAHFSKYGEFIVEKHVLAYIARRKI